MKQGNREKVAAGLISFGCLVSFAVFGLMILFFVNGFVLWGIVCLLIMGAMNLPLDALNRWVNEDSEADKLIYKNELSKKSTTPQNKKKKESDEILSDLKKKLTAKKREGASKGTLKILQTAIERIEKNK